MFQEGEEKIDLNLKSLLVFLTQNFLGGLIYNWGKQGRKYRFILAGEK